LEKPRQKAPEARSPPEPAPDGQAIARSASPAQGSAFPAQIRGLASGGVTSAARVAEPGLGRREMDPLWEWIRQAIQHRITYPALARRRGWEGQITVRFVLSMSGDVSELQVVESSGHPILDTAALQAVSSAVPLPSLSRTTEIAMPVVFSLAR
jgi:periplasmic protein TonB